MTDDLRASITAALEGRQEEPAPVVEAVSAPEPVADAGSAPAGEVDAVSGAAIKPEGLAERDEHGRFKAKDNTAEPPAAAAAPATTTSEPPEPAKITEPPQEATRIPPSLSAAIKAQWSALAPEVQKEFERIEGSTQAAKAEWDKKAQRFNRYEEIFAPHRDAWAVQGLSDLQAVERMVAAEQVLRTDPMRGIVYLAQTYGVNLPQIAMQMTGGQAPGAQVGQQPGQVAPNAADHPALQPLMEQVQTLQSQLTELTTGTAEAKAAEARSKIASFAADPANLYFNNVQDDVALLLETGKAETLEDAYQMAIWASPEIRPLLLKAEQDRVAAEAAERTARAQAEANDRARTQAAQHAAGSVTGAPSPGAVAPRPGSTGNLREDILAARSEVMSSV